MGKREPNTVKKMATDAKIRNLLRETGPSQTMSQSEIAEKTGLSRQLISRIERGAIEKVTEQIARIIERGDDGSA